LLVPDPALVDKSSGSPPLLVCKLLSGVRDAATNLALEKFELIVAVDADQLRVTSSVDPPWEQRPIISPERP